MTFSLERPAIYLITRGDATPENFKTTSRQIFDIIRIAVEQGIALVQVREKNLPARLVYELASTGAEIMRGSGTQLLVNDRADIAFAAAADGVHLTSTSIPVEEIRKVFSKDMIVGVSAHNEQEVQRASGTGADFVVFGPVFGTPGKPDAQGLDELQRVCESAKPFPVFAIGGLDETNASSVVDAGAAGIAAIRALNDPERLASMIEALNGRG